MRLKLVAVGQRLPAWAEAACGDYLARMPVDARVELRSVKAEPRTSGKPVQALKAAEAQRLLAACDKGARRVVLDEHGERVTTAALAERLRTWRHDGRDVALLIGGPDGLDDGLKDSADERLRLSDLTLPHALARVLLCEALYRAGSLLAGHPYHRE